MHSLARTALARRTAQCQLALCCGAVTFDNSANPNFTVLQVEVQDYTGASVLAWSLVHSLGAGAQSTLAVIKRLQVEAALSAAQAFRNDSALPAAAALSRFRS